MQTERVTLEEGWGVHEMQAAPQPGGGWLLFAADEIQLQKFADMKTHVSCWEIGGTR